MERNEQQRLSHYASATESKFLVNQSDLDPKDHAMPAMLMWCRKQKNIIVLKSGAILTSEPDSRLVQNCKIVMLNKGLMPGNVFAAASQLIQLLLDDAKESIALEIIDHSTHSITAQQQRLRNLIREALTLEASDIHIEIRKDIANIRLRKHGELFLHAEWLPRLAREITNIAFSKENGESETQFNPKIPQCAAITIEIDNETVRLRLASIPAHDGYDVVMRILTIGNKKIENFTQLGYSDAQVRLLEKAINMPYGAVVVSGPTGSGKTTTLASCMLRITPERKIYSIEDPVEKIIPNATQIPINTEDYEKSFAHMGRSSLRMDPDVMVLGEMRDEDTAQIMMRAAITGHLVFSTVHTNTAPDIVTRLNELGVSKQLLASPNLLVLLICQRLVPILCEYCSQSLHTVSTHHAHIPRWRKYFGMEVDKLRARGNNCQRCQGLGISGRTVAAEMIWVDAKAREFIQKGDILGWERYLKKQGWRSYSEQIIDYVRQGRCDPYDAEKLIGEIDATELQNETTTLHIRTVE